MAVRVKLTSLSDTQVKQISKILTIVPEIKQVGFKGKSIPRSSHPINIYTIHQYTEDGEIIPKEQETPENDDYINLPLFFAKKFLNKEQLKEVNSFRKEIPFPKFDHQAHPYKMSLRDDKKAPAEIALEQLKKYSTTTLKLYPGYGKTILGALMWYSTRMYMLTLVESVTLVNQHYKTITDSVPSLKSQIWRVGIDPMPEDPVVIICMEGRIEHIPAYIIDRIGCLIIDEAHKFCTPSRIEPLLRTRPKYIIIETATLGRRDGSHSIIYSIAGKHSVFRVSCKPHRVYNYKTDISFNLITNKFGPDFGALQKQIAESDEINELCIKLLLDNPHRKFIVLTSLTQHVKKLVKMAESEGIECDSLCENKSSYSDSFCLFGTVSKIGTGFDEANSCHDFKGRKSDTLILLTSMKAQIKAKKTEEGTSNEDISLLYSDEEIAEISRWEQIRGRVMRSDDPCIIYFNINHPVVKKHIKGITPWVKVTNGEIFNIDADDEFVI